MSYSSQLSRVGIEPASCCSGLGISRVPQPSAVLAEPCSDSRCAPQLSYDRACRQTHLYTVSGEMTIALSAPAPSDHKLIRPTRWKQTYRLSRVTIVIGHLSLIQRCAPALQIIDSARNPLRGTSHTCKTQNSKQSGKWEGLTV